MIKFIKKSFYCIIFVCLFICMLAYPALSLKYASMGLQLWFVKMIPTLLPFMIFSTLMIRLDLHYIVTGFLSPVLSPLFRVSKSCLYCIIIGFLCGFPMGAKVTSELYVKGDISKQEAQYLLSFCNNIGPIYFLSFVLPALQITKPAFFLFGMYGIPLLYGFLLRHTVYRKTITRFSHQKTGQSHPGEGPLSLLKHLDDSIMDSLRAITGLGGYMIIFNLCSCIPILLCSRSKLLLAFSGCLLEITGGIQAAIDSGITLLQAQIIILPLLLFGGLSCLAQTGSILRNTDLSMGKYCIHKLLQCVLAAAYYLVILL